MREGSAMRRLTWQDLSSPGATLASGVSAGFLTGLLIGGVGGRLAMLLLRLTSDPALRGAKTDDGFTIGVFSTETLFLLGVTAGLGILGGLFYLIVRGWIPGRWRVVVMTVYVGLVGGAGLVKPDGIDFNALSPLPLAVAMFVAIAAAYGAVMPWLTERMLRDGSIMRRGWTWIAGLLPLAASEHRRHPGAGGRDAGPARASLDTEHRRSVAFSARDVDRPNAARRDRVHQRSRSDPRHLRHPVVRSLVTTRGDPQPRLLRPYAV